ncbi:ExbD/TolR family protein [Mucilaginibacter calamicampi]|uniref:ExbD/TolR family protein n=1 Tax=Mucilaginibacter calamicampi TaxID=1302352 RepID=A0ABW2Z2M1_9SPHI
MAELNTSENSKGNTRSKNKALRVDLTAMVDLAFLLITFFILTTTLQEPKTMDLAMPVDGPETGIPSSRTLTILIGADSKASWYMGEADKPIKGPLVVALDKQGIRKVLLEQSALIKKQQGKDLIVLIKPSKQSIYGNVVGIMDELNITNNHIRAIADISPADVAILKKDKIYN